MQLHMVALESLLMLPIGFNVVMDNLLIKQN